MIWLYLALYGWLAIGTLVAALAVWSTNEDRARERKPPMSGFAIACLACVFALS